MTRRIEVEGGPARRNLLEVETDVRKQINVLTRIQPCRRENERVWRLGTSLSTFIKFLSSELIASSD